VSEDRLDRDDEDLSALLDGELAREREAELRDRMQRDGTLAERFARLAELQEELGRLATAQSSDAERIARLREGLERRLAAERVRPLVRRPSFRRWLAPAAAALAAGLLLYLFLPSVEPRPLPAPGAGEIEIAALSEEEIAIGLEYPTLADLDVIEELEILELLEAMDRPERM